MSPDRGANLAANFHSFLDQERLERAAQTEAERDERVETARVTATVLGSDARLSIELELTDGSDATLEVTIDQLGAILNASIS